MNKDVVKDFVYGGLVEFFKNPRNFRHYGQIDFSSITKDGEESLLELLSVVGGMIIKSEKLELDRRAKELTMSALKDNKS